MCIRDRYYLDPGHPAVADYLAAVVAELQANYRLDGIHLDLSLIHI